MNKEPPAVTDSSGCVFYDLRLPCQREVCCVCKGIEVGGISFRIIWLNEDKEFVGVCDRYPSLSHLAATKAEALAGIMALVADVEKADERPELPSTSKAEYEAALAEVRRLWGAEVGSEDGNRLDKLIDLVAAYEAEHEPWSRKTAREPLADAQGARRVSKAGSRILASVRNARAGNPVTEGVIPPSELSVPMPPGVKPPADRTDYETIEQSARDGTLGERVVYTEGAPKMTPEEVERAQQDLARKRPRQE